MHYFVDQIKNQTRLRFKNIYRFEPKIRLRLELGPYLLKTAETPGELIETFRLRHEVFNNEFRAIEGPGLDFDEHDYHFDHLIIRHKDSNGIIGTYRLSCSQFSKSSYTQSEFMMGSLLQGNSPVLELGRACIQKGYRKGSVLSLLWRGIAEYMTRSQSVMLFGCSSIKVNNTRDAALIYRYLVECGCVRTDYHCRPTKDYEMNDFDSWYSYFSRGLQNDQVCEAENLIPSLLKSYLKMGAKVVSEPAFDKDFDCIDVLTVLKKEELSESLAERFRIS